MGKTTYHLKIHTGDECYADTDSNIFITLVGTLGQSDEYRLNGKIKGNAFERNQTDKCTLELPESVGDVYKIQVRSDCMYAGADWLLDYIEICREKASDERIDPPVCHFKCREWIEDIKVKEYEVTSGFNVAQDIKSIT